MPRSTRSEALHPSVQPWTTSQSYLLPVIDDQQRLDVLRSDRASQRGDHLIVGRSACSCRDHMRPWIGPFMMLARNTRAGVVVEAEAHPIPFQITRFHPVDA